MQFRASFTFSHATSAQRVTRHSPGLRSGSTPIASARDENLL